MTASAVYGKICNKPDMISCYLETCTSIESCSTLKYKCTPYAGSPKPVCMITIFIETMLLDMTAQENDHAWSFSSGVMCTRLCWISCWWELVGQNSILVVALFWVPWADLEQQSVCLLVNPGYIYNKYILKFWWQPWHWWHQDHQRVMVVPIFKYYW